MKKPSSAIYYNKAGESGLRYVENIDNGLRFKAYADQIAREHDSRAIDHHGWFCDEFQEETTRGVVYRLPHNRFIAGYASSRDTSPISGRRGNWNAPSGAALDFTCVHDDELEAAKASDELARIAADHERDYNAAWQAGNRFADLARDISEAWSKLKGLARDRYRARLARAGDYPSLCAAIDNMASALFESIEKARKERRELQSNFGSTEAFKEGADL